MSGVTDALFASVEQGSLNGLEPHFERHRAVAQALLGGATAFLTELTGARAELADLLARAAAAPPPEGRAPLRDAVVSQGERLSSALLTAVLGAAGLEARWVDARRCIVTDDTHGRAAPDIRETERRTRAALGPLLERGEVPVLGGYVGATHGGVTTTLGRGGAGHSAAPGGGRAGRRGGPARERARRSRDAR